MPRGTRRSGADLAPPMAFGRYDQWFNPDAVAISLGSDIPPPARSASPTSSGDDGHSEADPQVDDQGFQGDNLVTDATAGEPEQEEQPDQVSASSLAPSTQGAPARGSSTLNKARRRRSASASAQRAAKAPKMFRHTDGGVKKAIGVRAQCPCFSSTVWSLMYARSAVCAVGRRHCEWCRT